MTKLWQNQGRDQMAKYLFVFDELPSVYKNVCTKTQTSIGRIESKPEDVRIPFKCNQCKVTSRTLADLRKYTKTKHKQLPKLSTQFSTELLITEVERKSTKRLTIFTPIAKPPKRCKPEQSILAISNEEPKETAKITLDEYLSIGDLSMSESVEDLPGLKMETNSQEMKYSCVKCGGDCIHKNQLEEHLTNEHGTTKLEKLNNLDDTVVVCGECNKGFKSICEVEVHMKSHEVTAPVGDVCNERVANVPELNIHKDDHHDNPIIIEDVTCRYCGFDANTSEILRMHLNTKHCYRKCNKCEFTTNSENDFMEHLKSNHMDVGVIIHIEDMQEVVQPIKCPNCDYKCLLNRQMKNHIKKTHINENQECKYKCNFCGFESDVLITMYEHKFEEHPDEPVEFHPKTLKTSF